MAHKNIHLFRGQNTFLLSNTLIAWKEKFIEKYGEMNLAEVRKQDFTENVLSDCISPGFMGMTRMIILPDLLIKTEKEISNLQEKENQMHSDEEETNTTASLALDGSLWIKMLSTAPETNFFIFLGNKTPVTDLEKWLAEHATIHEFAIPSGSEIQTTIKQSLGVSDWQASRIQERLNNNYYFIHQELQKLQLAEKTTWTDDELKNVLPNYFEENNFNILTPLWRQDSLELLTTFRDILRTADRELTMAMLTTMIRKVLIASYLPSDTSIRAVAAIKPSQAATAKKIGNERTKLKKLYDELVTIDTQEKQGESTGKLDAFLMTLLSYCEGSKRL